MKLPAALRTLTDSLPVFVAGVKLFVMCGRFTLSSSADVVAELFALEDPLDLAPRYNIAPTQDVPVVRARADGRRAAHMLHWGLIPSWSKESAPGSRMINARAETVTSKRSFRESIQRRRCLVVADGFYEWQKVEGGKQPYLIRLSDGRPFGFAGLWDRWRSRDGETVDSCTIITTAPNALMAEIHDRMPVIVDASRYATWLDAARGADEELLSWLTACPAEAMDAVAVSKVVNNPRNDTPACTVPLQG